jgi:hypothetical protein
MVDEIKWLFETLIKYSLGGLVAGSIIYLLIKNHLGSYLTEKGKNLATKEDIADITDKVRSVEHQYNVLIHDLQSKQQLRMAALDKRLHAHQEAFALWRLMSARKNSEIETAITNCEEWWRNNCLYLEPEVREAFVTAYISRRMQLNWLLNGGSEELINELWEDVRAFPEILFKAVKLPGFSKIENEAIAQS